MFRIAAVATSLFFGLTHLAAAQDQQPVVLELYTSQGCSSCPPADAILEELIDRDDVIAIALHVDYWDYIGWKDTMADPAYTSRQRAYARAAGHRSIFTPQMVIGGKDHVVGTKPMQVSRLLELHRQDPYDVDLELVRDGNSLTVTATSNGDFSGDAVVQLVRYVPKTTVAIRRGENGGRTLDYHNTVNYLSEIGEWDGRGTFTTTAEISGDEPIAILMQRPDNGPIVAAAKLEY